MKKIIIDPHHCSREEYEELTEYLTSKSWDFKILDERAEMLDNLGYYVCNEPSELPAILDTLLAYEGDSYDLEEICPDLILCEKVQTWDYSQLMGAI